MTVHKFEFFQPQGGSDPAWSATGTSGITVATPALTPLMLNNQDVLVPWDGSNAGTAVGVLSLNIDGTDTTVPYFKSGTWRMEDLVWPEGITDAMKRNAFTGTAISVV